MFRTHAPLAFFSVLAAAVLYKLGTYGGILDSTTRLIGLLALAALGVVWLRGRDVRVHTALDRVLPLWALSFAISFLANLDAWRRMLTAFWYMGLYVALWYALHDLIAARRLRRETLINALLIGGSVVLFQGWMQAANGISRPPSTLENANTLAAFLVILIPFAAGRIFTVKAPLIRLALLVYTLAAAGLLALTFSRSAWLALGAALLVQAWLNGQVIWARWGRGVRLVAVGIFALITGLGVWLLIRTFSLGGRTLDLRTDIYAAALHMFSEKPLTGYGLFTFGRELPRFWSTPPLQVHSHAHDVPLQIAAELGLPGLMILAMTVIVFLRAMRAHYRAASSGERALIASGIAASLAFGLHHLADVPAMNPAIALVGVVMLVVAASPPTLAMALAALSARGGEKPVGEGLAPPVEFVRKPSKISTLTKFPLRLIPPPSLWVIGQGDENAARAVGVPLSNQGSGGGGIHATIFLLLLLLLTGLWDTALYMQYSGVLWAGMNGGDLRQTAEQFQPIIDADPALAIYHQEQGYFYGLAAYGGDSEALPAAISAYQHFVALEPNSAVGWANLAALRWQRGEQKAALDLMRRTIQLAPRSWSLAFQAGAHAERAGEMELARSLYWMALSASPDLMLYPGWTNTTIQRELSGVGMPSESGAILLALERGEVQAARADWERSSFSRSDSTESNVVLTLLNIAEGHLDAAETALQRAQAAAVNAEDAAWLRVGEARLARARGDESAAEAALAAARSIVEPGFFESDYEAGANVASVQFFRWAVPRQFLPQVGYENFTPTVLHLVMSNE